MVRAKDPSLARRKSILLVLPEELYSTIKEHTDNMSAFIREAILEKLNQIDTKNKFIKIEKQKQLSRTKKEDVLKAVSQQEKAEITLPKTKEVEKLNNYIEDNKFAVALLKKDVRHSLSISKTNPHLKKRNFYESIGVEFNYEKLCKDLAKDYQKILKMSDEELTKEYEISFNISKVRDKNLFEYVKYSYLGYKKEDIEVKHEIYKSVSILKK